MVSISSVCPAKQAGKAQMNILKKENVTQFTKEVLKGYQKGYIYINHVPINLDLFRSILRTVLTPLYQTTHASQWLLKHSKHRAEPSSSQLGRPK